MFASQGKSSMESHWNIGKSLHLCLPIDITIHPYIVTLHYPSRGKGRVLLHSSYVHAAQQNSPENLTCQTVYIITCTWVAFKRAFSNKEKRVYYAEKLSKYNPLLLLFFEFSAEGEWTEHWELRIITSLPSKCKSLKNSLKYVWIFQKGVLSSLLRKHFSLSNQVLPDTERMQLSSTQPQKRLQTRLKLHHFCACFLFGLSGAQGKENHKLKQSKRNLNFKL